MPRHLPLLLAAALAMLAVAPARSSATPPPRPASGPDCWRWDAEHARRNPTERELRCRFGAHGPGRFGLISYADVPVYQPATPMPGTHVVGLTGHASPLPGESYEAWEWRVHRTEYGPEARRVRSELDVLHPFVAARILALEAALRAEGVAARRRETWRSPERQAYLFQQGRSRPGPIATATLTSWHSQVDSLGRPAGRAVDYDVARRDLPRFHEIARTFGLDSFGADSNDPGHVFLPEEASLPPLDVIVLRTLPRVPVVTLATGRPVDDPAPPPLPELRAAVERFAREPFFPHPRPELAGARLPREPITRPAPPPPLAARAPTR